MDVVLQQFAHLKLQLEEITLATENFNDEKNCIGVGGFGKVYKGQVCCYKGRSMAAIKRLDRRHGQGIPEFLKEITALARYTHENIMSLLGFCYQGDEMILVYEYASHGSLDSHLNSPHLTWVQRLKICLDAAKGLRYLHDPRETHQRLIHCDIKSSNILLDDEWNAKLSDFGLSIMGPANEQYSVIVTNAAGTLGYCDPQYAMTHTLTKESDVYSFGVVLFEVLCGRLCYTYRNDDLVPTWIESYEQKKLNDVVFKTPTVQPLDESALETISDIAYRCLKKSREERPKMGDVVAELEIAIESQVFSDWKPLFDYQQMTKTAEPPLNYRSKVELRRLLSKGILLDEGKTWFSLNKKGEHCEMISFAKCLDSSLSEFDIDSWSFRHNSRFVVGTYCSCSGRFKTRVQTQLLSPGITYTVNLMFKGAFYNNGIPVKATKCRHICLKYKLQGETKTSISYLAFEREDGWWTCELYQFTSHHETIDLEIWFHGFTDDATLYVEGIEFRPLENVEGIECWPMEKVEHKASEDENLDMQLNSHANWEEKLPTNYEDIMKWSKDSVQWTTKTEAYSIMRRGFIIEDDKKRNIWFSIDKNGKKYHMLSARAAVYLFSSTGMLQLPETRFGEAYQCNLSRSFSIKSEIQSILVSSQTMYAGYLVYKLPEEESKFEAPIIVEYIGWDNSWYIYLVSPQTPVIRPKADQSTHNPHSRPIVEGLPKQRDDGWIEVEICEFQTATTTKNISMHLKLTPCDGNNLSGLIIQGIEFRPI